MQQHKGILTGAVVLLCLVTFTPASVNADSFHHQLIIEHFASGGQRQILANVILDQITCESSGALNLSQAKSLVDFADAATPSAARNGGFSIAAFHRGPTIGLVRPGSSATVTQNPEPATLLLLGTGLTAFAAYARKRRRRR